LETATVTDTGAIFRIENVSKRYGGTVALNNANLAVRAGSIHAVLGENGAGKSTLMKIMAGVIAPNEGRMLLDGREVRFATPARATAAGVICVFQELSLIPDLSVAENILLANPPRRLGMIDARAQRRLAEEALTRAGALDIHPSMLVRDLPLSRKQIVEIAKALARGPRILILDEATSALSQADVRTIFEVLKRLRAEGISLLYISHRMSEIEELADECTVFRNGRSIESFAAGARSRQETIEMMIGREYKHVFPPKPATAPQTAPALTARDLNWGEQLNGINLDLRPGEIVGLGGLDGQGQRELLLALFGVLRQWTGSIAVDGKPTRLSGPRAAKAEAIGMALIPEDRKSEGLMLPMSVAENLTMAGLGRVSRFGVIDSNNERKHVAELLRRLHIQAASPDVPVGSLSGGNQQKVVIAKWLLNDPRIFLLNDPTRGIDVGTKQELYRLLRALADDGAAILFYSTEYEELIGCCNRVLVMYRGRVVSELAGDDLTERQLLAGALNISAVDEQRKAAS
jgi:ribose transport system ATP-binding protein